MKATTPVRAMLMLAVEGTVPRECRIIEDADGNTSVQFPDGRIFEPFLGWAVREKPPTHGEPPTALMTDDGDDVVVPDANHSPIPVGTRPAGFSFNHYHTQRIVLEEAT